MLKAFVKSSVVYSITAILGRGVALLLLPLYTQVLSPSDYGIVDILDVLANLCYLIVALEVSQGFFRFYPDASSVNERAEYASTAFFFTCFTYTAFLAMGLVFARPIAHVVLEASDSVLVVRLSVISIWLYGPYYLTLLLFRSRLEPLKFAVTNLAMTLVTIGTSIVTVLLLKLGAMGVVLGRLAGHAAGVIIAMYLARRSYRAVLKKEKLLEMLRFSLPLVPSSLGVFGAQYIDRIMVSKLLSLWALGLFGIAYRIASLLSLVIAALANSWTPLVYENYRKPETPDEIAKVFRFYWAMILLVFIGVSLFAHELIRVMAPIEYIKAAEIVPFLAASVVLSHSYVFAPGLAIAKKTKTIATINIAQGLLSLALSLALVPRLDILGAALASSASAGVGFLVNMSLSQRYYFVSHNWYQIAAATLIATSITVVGTQLPTSLGGTSTKVLILLFAGVACVWLRLIKISELKQSCESVTRWLLQIVRAEEADS